MLYISFSLSLYSFFFFFGWVWEGVGDGGEILIIGVTIALSRVRLEMTLNFSCLLRDPMHLNYKHFTCHLIELLVYLARIFQAKQKCDSSFLFLFGCFKFERFFHWPEMTGKNLPLIYQLLNQHL